MNIVCACATDRGNYRTTNQDAIFVNSIAQKKKIFAVGAVFDGIGGLEKGEIASTTLLFEMEKWFTQVSGWIDLSTIGREILFSHFRDLAECLNDKIRRIRLNQNIESGSTMSAIMIVDRYYLVIHAGDSRLYKFNQVLECLTDDDVVAKYVDGFQKNYLTNFMGKSEELHFSEYMGMVEEGDSFIFCSDGFYHQLKAEDLTLLGNCSDAQELEKRIQQLITVMVSRGERDNISAGVINFQPDSSTSKFKWGF